jgi:hypothetical protein
VPKDFNRPDYPKSLTRANWDKKKSLLAKAAGETGVGEAMDAAKGAYDAVDWDKLEGCNHAPSGNNFTKAAWKAVRDDAMKEVTGNLAKFSRSLYDLRDVARTAAAKFQKAKTVPKSDGKLALEIATEADHLGVAMNKNSVSGLIEERYQDFQKTYDDMVANVQANLRKTVAGAKIAAGQIAKDPTTANFNSRITSAARNITQTIGNIPRFIAAGYDVGIDAGTAKKLFDEMKDWANKIPYLPQDTAEPEVKKELMSFVKALKQCETLAG